LDNPDALIVDTNILIDFLEPGKYTEEQFYKFLMRVNGPFTQLILPEQVLKEWNYLKNLKIEQYKKQIVDDFQKYEELINHVPEPVQKETLYNQIENIRKLSMRAYHYTYAIRAKLIDEIISSFGLTIERNADVDKLVVDFAIEQKAPFFFMELKKESKSTSKNESSDAVIFFSVINYFRSNRDTYYKVAFLSSNSKDFSQPNNPSVIHENLKNYFEKLGIIFFNNLNATQQFLNYEEAEQSFETTVSTIVSSNEGRHKYLTDKYFIKCKECQGDVHINSDTVTIKQYYHYRCPSCNHTWNSGDHVLDSIY
jgi:predicted Zn finger-like uncharacterized protein